ncbi:MAG: DnaB-like helicase N-terminal domain-containing protein, partial [Nostoc sp.]
MSENLNFDDTNKLPPQNIEAEEAILGGILLDPDAIGRVRDTLIPEAFYISAHKDIYQAALRLHSQSKPTDLLSVTSWLTDHDFLFRIGGRNKLATLVDRTVSAVNIDALAELVMEKYYRRQLAKAASEIYHLAHDQNEEIVKQLETAESKILEINNSAIASTSVPTLLNEILVNAYSSIEEKSMGISPSGVKTGFYDLDA